MVILIFLYFFDTSAPPWCAFRFLGAFRSLSRIIPLLPLLHKPPTHCSLQQWDQRFHHRQHPNRQHTHARVQGARLVSLRPIAVPCVQPYTQWMWEGVGSWSEDKDGIFEGNRWNWNSMSGAIAQNHALFFPVKGHRRHPRAALVISHVQPLTTRIIHVRKVLSKHVCCPGK